MSCNQDQEDVYACPSFSSYSLDGLAEAANRAATGIDDDDDDEFEFAMAGDDHEASDSIGSIYPVFDLDLLSNNDYSRVDEDGRVLRTSSENKMFGKTVLDEGGYDYVSRTSSGDRKLLVSLGQLFLEDRGEDSNRYPPSCSSSEGDELDSIPEGTYCVWQPKPTPPLPSQCRKSKSTGSASKRWKIPDFLKRSNSEGGKGNLVILPPKSGGKSTTENNAPRKGKDGKGGLSAVGSSKSAHEALYVRNRALKEGDKRKSYLPYRQDLVGLFANVNGFGRSFTHF